MDNGPLTRILFGYKSNSTAQFFISAEPPIVTPVDPPAIENCVMLYSFREIIILTKHLDIFFIISQCWMAEAAAGQVDSPVCYLGMK